MSTSADLAPGLAPFFTVMLTAGAQPPSLLQVEQLYVAQVLAHFHGRRTAAAAALGISYPTFLKRLRELGFERSRRRPVVPAAMGHGRSAGTTRAVPTPACTGEGESRLR